MFRPIDMMTDEEKLQELEDLKILLELKKDTSVEKLLRKELDTDLLQKYDMTLTPNGQFFNIKRQGFLAEMMETMYNDRSAYKKKAIAAKKELEQENDPSKRFEIEKRIARYNNLQLAKKVCL